MPDYRRWWVEGGTFFFTVVTYDRRPILEGADARALLRSAYNDTLVRYQIESLALVVLPDHLHAIWVLAGGQTDYAKCWSALKSNFTRAWLAAGGAEAQVTPSQEARGRRGVWQRNYWAHYLPTTTDFEQHLDYIHYNPVRHGYAACPHAWRFSTFRRWISFGVYEPDWGCICDGAKPDLSSLRRLPSRQME